VGRYCKRAAVIREGRLLVTDMVDRLSHTGIKRVTLRGATAMPALESARDIKIEQDALTFLYGGGTKELLAALSNADFEDFTVTDPDLEEVFMHYYTKEDA